MDSPFQVRREGLLCWSVYAWFSEHRYSGFELGRFWTKYGAERLAESLTGFWDKYDERHAQENTYYLNLKYGTAFKYGTAPDIRSLAR